MDSGYPMEELVPIVAKLARRAAGGESTSVSYEKAQQLMEAVLYCIQEYEAGSGSLPRRTGMPAEEVYRLGRRMVTDKVLLLKECYHVMLPDFCDYGMDCLRDVVMDGIPAFLKWYDVLFCPQDTILTLDYPVLCKIAPQTGVDAVFTYVNAIALEQKFLAGFEDGYVRGVLRAYQADYEEMPENICSIVLPDVLGRLLLQKPLMQGKFTQEELKRLAGRIGSREEMKRFIQNMVARMAAQRYNGDRKLEQYLQGEADNLAERICRCSELGCLERVFVMADVGHMAVSCDGSAVAE